MKTRLDYLFEYRKLKQPVPFETYVYWLAMYLIHQYVNEWLAYGLTTLYVVALFPAARRLSKIDDEIEHEIYKMKLDDNQCHDHE